MGGDGSCTSSTSFRISPKPSSASVLEQLCPSLAQVVLLPPLCLVCRVVIYPTKAFSRRLAPVTATPLQLKRPTQSAREDQSRQRARTASFVLSKQETSRVIMQTSMSVTTTF